MNPRLTVRKGITALKVVLEKVGKAVYQSEYEKTRNEWYAAGCEDTLRTSFDFLGESSVVFDAGGWKGDWASDIYAKYQPTIFVFEPVTAYAQRIGERFARNRKIKVFGCGLGARDGEFPIYLGNEGTSIFRNGNTGGAAEKIRIRDVVDFLSSNNVAHIDLFKINIEGAEYELLERLIESGAITRIDALLIQFHDFVDEAAMKRERIRTSLAKTHALKFDYPFVWECWSRK